MLRQGICAGIAISKQPISAAAFARLSHELAQAAKGSGVSLPMWEAMGFGINTPMALDYAPGIDPSGLYAPAVTARGAELLAFLDALPLDYSPATDDRPFFFQFLKPEHWTELHKLPKDDFFASGLLGHARFVAGFLLLAALLTLAPLFGASTRARAKPLLFFGCLGLGYMLVELALIQRTVLLLGHPTHSVSVTLATMLVGSGVGAMWSGHPRARAAPSRFIRLAIGAVIVLISVYDATLAELVDVLLPLPWLIRAAALALVVFPLGLVMGVAFPIGLSRCDKSLAAWGLGINAFTGVLGSLIAVPIAMLVGFRGVMLGAAAVYLLAGLAAAWRHDAFA